MWEVESGMKPRHRHAACGGQVAGGMRRKRIAREDALRKDVESRKWKVEEHRHGSG